MRLKELRGLPVIDPTAARRIGIISDYEVDPASRRIAALDITGIQDGARERVLAQRIRRVGESAVMLTARGGSQPGTDAEINDRWLDSSTLVGLDVMGDDGNRVGQLMDALFDQDTLQVEAYLLRSSFFERLMGRPSRIEPEQVHACSRELMIISTGRVKEAETPPDEAVPLADVRMPLKKEDRLPAPSYKPVADGQPVTGRTR